MAVPPDCVQHPDLGELVWLAEDNRWFGEYRDSDGHTTDVFVEPGAADPVAFLDRAGELFRCAIAARHAVLTDAMSESLISRFREEWGDDYRGQLTPDELITRLEWVGLVIADEPFPVIYEYTPLTAGLFGVHNIINLYTDESLHFRFAGYYRSGPPPASE